jgi:hypothetical protein
MSTEGKRSRRDHLTATTPDGKIELTEEELSRVAGGIDPGAGSKFSKLKHVINTKDKLDTAL